MTLHERIDLLTDAKNDIGEAIEKIKMALQGTNHEAHADAYIIPHLQIWIDSVAYMSKDCGIEQYIELLQNEDQ